VFHARPFHGILWRFLSVNALRKYQPIGVLAPTAGSIVTSTSERKLAVSVHTQDEQSQLNRASIAKPEENGFPSWISSAAQLS
jgi:hypothetical protein